jgi:Uma2 family endonuclease
MSTRSDGATTVEDLYLLPDDGQRYELVAGVLISEPLPGARHGRVAVRIAYALRAFVEREGLGEGVVADTGFVLARDPDTVRGPDVAFIARERYEAAGDPPTAFPGAPDLAVEVVSPSNRPGDVRAKVADYLAAGTRLVWVVDPDPARLTITAYETLLSPRVHGADDEIDGSPVLPGFRCRVRDLM